MLMGKMAPVVQGFVPVMVAPLIIHTLAKVHEHGMIRAFVKSFGRKGSWLASAAHFWAMVRLAIVPEKRNNLFGWYALRTGERHPPEHKQMMREANALLRTERFKMYFPSEARDDAVMALYADEETLKYLDVLKIFGQDRSKLIERRNDHRQGFRDGTSWFVDIIDSQTGNLVGTTGFRSLSSDRTGEFGVIIHSQYQRTGILTEILPAVLHYGTTVLNLSRITALTLPMNLPMQKFLNQDHIPFHPTTDPEEPDFLVYEYSG